MWTRTIQYHANAQPLTIAQQMDAACAKKPADEQYGTEVQPAELRPYGVPERHRRSVCHTLDATYIQMPLGGPNPTNVPSLVQDDPGGTRVVNYTDEHESRMRIKRQIGGSATACAVQQKGSGERRIRRRVRGGGSRRRFTSFGTPG